MAGVERLAFSVTWDMTAEGHILSQWAGRSIIKSCAKLAYGHAQDMIEGTFKGLPDQEPPPVQLHGCQWPQVRPTLLSSACWQHEFVTGFYVSPSEVHGNELWFCSASRVESIGLSLSLEIISLPQRLIGTFSLACAV